MNFLWDWFSISVWQKKWVQSRTAMDHRVNLIYYKRCFNPNKKIFSWWTKLWRQVHVEESWKLVGRVTCTGSLGKNTWSMIKKKRRKNSVSVSKLNKNIIKNGEHYLFQIQNKEFISKNHGESNAWLSCLSSMGKHLDIDNVKAARKLRHSIVEIFIAVRASKK